MRSGMTMELETTTKVPVERLRLDRENRGSSARQRMRPRVDSARLYRSAELDELLQSISTNGSSTSSRSSLCARRTMMP